MTIPRKAHTPLPASTTNIPLPNSTQHEYCSIFNAVTSPATARGELGNVPWTRASLTNLTAKPCIAGHVVVWTTLYVQ